MATKTRNIFLCDISPRFTGPAGGRGGGGGERRVNRGRESRRRCKEGAAAVAELRETREMNR